MSDAVDIEIGLERFVRQQRERRTVNGRVGLLVNRASVDNRLAATHQVIGELLPGQLTAIFAPQHGWWGEQQANMLETPHDHAELPAPVYSLYADQRRPDPQMLDGLDHFVIDLQDVGTRVYTFVWTMLNCLEACGERGIEVIVLDRPNPIGGDVVEGPLLERDYRSFVGQAEIPMRHGLTMGELAQMLVVENRLDVALSVIQLEGWLRNHRFRQLGRLWIPPSPNLPTPESTLVYPGQVLLEGTNLSEGRGTTIPFECVGAPYIDSRKLKDAMEQFALPGIRFLETRFTPTFDKWVGESCGGLSWHVVDTRTFRPYRTTVCLLHACQTLWPDDFAWLEPPYEYELTKPPIDIISGSDRLRTKLTCSSIDHLSDCDDVAWRNRSEPFRLYSQ
jgi:uncharacterized protein YbbC (DUF1343 family)